MQCHIGSITIFILFYFCNCKCDSHLPKIADRGVSVASTLLARLVASRVAWLVPVASLRFTTSRSLHEVLEATPHVALPALFRVHNCVQIQIVFTASPGTLPRRIHSCGYLWLSQWIPDIHSAETNRFAGFSSFFFFSIWQICQLCQPCGWYVFRKGICRQCHET